MCIDLYVSITHIISIAAQSGMEAPHGTSRNLTRSPRGFPALL
jgi:hypothetical protein